MVGKSNKLFRQWQVLPEDNLESPEVRMRFFGLAEKLVKITNRIDRYYRILFLSQCLQMVLGGLKPMTVLSFDKGLLREYQKAELLDEFDVTALNGYLYEYFGLRITEKIIDRTDGADDYFVYNPALIQKISQKYFPDYVQFDSLEINTWIMSLLSSGVPAEKLMGILFGFPISAVKQHLKYQTADLCRLEKRKVVSNYGESYVIWGDNVKRDVRVREMIKDEFFTNLAHNNLYLDLVKRLNKQAAVYRQVSRSSFERMIQFHTFSNHE